MSLAPFAAQVWRVSWQAAALVALVWIAQLFCGRRLPPRWRYNLWLLVVARLLIPVLPQSPLSVFNLLCPPPSALLAVETPVEAPPPAPAPALRSLPAAPTPATADSEPSTAPAVAAPPPAPAVVPLPAPAPPPPRRMLPWKQWLAELWLAGVVLLGAQVGRTTLRTFRQVRRAAPLLEPETLALLEECRERMGLRRTLPLYETSLLQSPALFGLFQPVLLLPPGFSRRFSAVELRHVFLHELAHLARRDLLWNWLLTLLQIVHWFNPAIWFGFARLRADRELACDALALSRSGESAGGTYGSTIIKLLETLARPAGSAGLVGILESRQQMARRIRMIASFRPEGRWSWPALLLMLALAALGLTDAVRATRAQAAAPPPPAAAMRLSVRDAATGLPIPGATLFSPFGNDLVYTAAPTPRLTDSTGVALLPPDAVSIMGFLAVHPDYAPAAVTWAWARSSSLPPRPTPVLPTECTISLERGLPLGGVVRDEGGRPLAGVRVEISGTMLPQRDGDETTPLQYPAFHPLLNPGPLTDAEGRWRCAHFPAGVEFLQLDFIRPDGSLARFHTPPPPWTSAPGGVEIPVEQAHSEALVTVLQPGLTVRGVVLDAAGQPLPGIAVTESDRRGSRPAFVVPTGADGRFELRNRDPHQVLLTAVAPGMALAAEVVTIAPGLPEVRMRLRPAQPLALRVVDEAGRPLPGVALAPVDLRLGWQGQTDAEGRAAWPIAPRTPLEYQFFAEGFRSRKVSLTAAAGEQTVTLQRGQDEPPRESEDESPAKPPAAALPAFAARFSLPDGQPAAGASVALTDPAQKERPWTMLDLMFGGKPRLERRENPKVLRADAAGRLALPSLSADTEILAVHEGGLLLTTVASARVHPEMGLSAWGRIEGTLKINGQPQAGQRLELHFAPHSFPGNLNFSHTATTDRDGRFHFDRAPAGRLRLHRTMVSEGQWPRSNPISFEVAAGETAHVAYEVTGRAVTGRLQLSPPGLEFDWKKNAGVPLLTRVPVRRDPPAYDDFVRFADYRHASAAWSADLASADPDTYGAAIDPDGSFRFEAVAPGRYELNLTAFSGKGADRKEIATLRRPVTIADGPLTEAHPLGIIEVGVPAGSFPQRSEVAFTASDLHGQALPLSSFRGRTVLVHFWAGWAPLSAARRALLQTLQAAYGGDPRFALLNVSLDDTAAAAGAAGLPGVPAWLEGRARFTTTEALAIDQLPALLLVGPDGRLLARDLPEARWSAAIHSALHQ